MRANERPRLGAEAAVNVIQSSKRHSTGEPETSERHIEATDIVRSGNGDFAARHRLALPATDRQDDSIQLSDAIARLTAMLPRLADAIQKTEGKPRIDRMTLRVDELAEALGVSRRVIERERAAGRFPKPDLTIGKMPLWRVETVRRWIEGGGRP